MNSISIYEGQYFFMEKGIRNSFLKAKLELPCQVANKQILVAGSFRSPKSPHFKAHTLQKLNIQAFSTLFFI